MKERLTGAIILVALLVLLVPELLTGPGPTPATEPAGPEGVPLRSYTIDLADDAAARRPGAAAPTSTAPVPATDEPAEQASTEPDAEGAGESASPAGDGSADAASSDTLSGEAAFAEASEAEAGKPDAAEPEQPRSAFGPNAVSRAQPQPSPSSSASGSAPSARPSGAVEAPSSATRASSSASTATKGWAVQLGVFASRENAERLAKQVKGKGYPVVVHEISGSKRLFRVRVGPEPDRAAAVALGAKLRAAGHAGTVVPYP